MNLLNKVKNFFYEDEDETENEVEEEIHKEKKVKVKKFDDIKENKEVSERELFKAERTFNFPVFEDDETDFNGINEEENVQTNIVKEPLYRQKTVEKKETTPYSGLRSYAKTEERKEERDNKKFKPTPVISPIYGIMDKNYKKEDLIIDSVENHSTKKIDYDTVRRKAYGNIYGVEQEEKKDIFYNLDEEEPKEKEDNDEVKIIYNDVTFDEDEEDDENVTIGERIEKYEKKLDEENSDIDDDNDILSQTNEQDLFNLIDNMYNSDDEDDEEEE